LIINDPVINPIQTFLINEDGRFSSYLRNIYISPDRVETENFKCNNIE